MALLLKKTKSVSVFTYMVKANQHNSIFFLKSLTFLHVFYVKSLPGIMPSRMGLVVTLPAIVPLTIKQDDHKLHNRFSSLDLYAFFSNRSFLW